MEDIFGTINSITGITKYSSSEVITPKRIVADMVDLLPAGIYTPEAKFLDPAVKSGRFLAEIYRRLMDSELMKQAFPNTDERKLHIRRNQLYGFATSSLAAAVTRKQLYDDPQETGNIMYTADKVTKEMIQGAFGIMKFDVVIGNPPYNNDIYLDFVTLGHNLASKYTCMITPAKWQAKGGEKNEQFRKDIVPYMSKIVFYPCVTDIFDITSVGGITYYLISKEKADKVKLDIISVNPKSFHGNSSIEIDRSINRNTYYNTMLEQIVSKCISGKRLGNIIFKTIHEGTHMVKVSHLVDDKHYSNCIGGYILTPVKVSLRETPGQNMYELFAGTEDACKSFKSYIDTKLVRFLVALGLCASSTRNVETWRFVPDPGAFDHIFTDQELYQKYGLTQEEISIIEFVIKERK